MAKNARRRGGSGRGRGPRRRAPLAERLIEFQQLESGVPDDYELLRVVADHLNGNYVWRIPVTVPGYDQAYTLRIELSEGSPVAVIAEDWVGRMKHTYGRNRLCMWLPSDPPERRWQRTDGLLKLIDTAVVHLFRELYWRGHGEWLGEEAPHGIPKVEARIAGSAAA